MQVPWKGDCEQGLVSADLAPLRISVLPQDETVGLFDAEAEAVLRQHFRRELYATGVVVTRAVARTIGATWVV